MDDFLNALQTSSQLRILPYVWKHSHLYDQTAHINRMKLKVPSYIGCIVRLMKCDEDFILSDTVTSWYNAWTLQKIKVRFRSSVGDCNSLVFAVRSIQSPQSVVYIRSSIKSWCCVNGCKHMFHSWCAHTRSHHIAIMCSFSEHSSSHYIQIRLIITININHVKDRIWKLPMVSSYYNNM